jgi:hypothetical protein
MTGVIAAALAAWSFLVWSIWQVFVGAKRRLSCPTKPEDVAYWHFTSFCCNAKLRRNRLISDMVRHSDMSRSASKPELPEPLSFRLTRQPFGLEPLMVISDGLLLPVVLAHDWRCRLFLLKQRV